MSIADKLLQIKEDLFQAFQKGKEASMQNFSDLYQTQPDGTPINNYYLRFVQSGWDDNTFSYIKHPICCSGGGSNARSVFSRCQISRIGVPVSIVDTEASETFYYATKLEEIAKLTLRNVPGFNKTFTGCTKLRHMILEGSIDVDFNISAAPDLDEETRQSIIDCLTDLTGKSQQTLTFHNTAGEKLTPEQRVAITGKNWELVY